MFGTPQQFLIDATQEMALQRHGAAATVLNFALRALQAAGCMSNCMAASRA